MPWIPKVPVHGESFHVRTLIRHAQGFGKIKFAFEFWSHKNIISRKREYKQTCLGIHEFKLMCALRATWRSDDLCLAWELSQTPRLYVAAHFHCHHLHFTHGLNPLLLSWAMESEAAMVLPAWRVTGGTGPAVGSGTLRGTFSKEQVGPKATLSLWSDSCPCLHNSHQPTLLPQRCATAQLVHLNEFPFFRDRSLQSLTIKKCMLTAEEENSCWNYWFLINVHSFITRLFN